MPLGTCLNGHLHQVLRNEIAGLARIQTSHLGWALETAGVIDVRWEGEGGSMELYLVTSCDPG